MLLVMFRRLPNREETPAPMAKADAYTRLPLIRQTMPVADAQQQERSVTAHVSFNQSFYIGKKLPFVIIFNVILWYTET